MNWNSFNTHGESKEKAFEIFSNQIFKVYCEEKYKDYIKKFVVINGAGGDGGIEAYAELWNKNIIAITMFRFILISFLRYHTAISLMNVTFVRNFLK